MKTLRNSVYSSVLTSVNHSVYNSVYSSVLHSVGDSVSASVYSSVLNSVWNSVIFTVRLSAERNFKEKINEHLLRIQNYKN